MLQRGLPERIATTQFQGLPVPLALESVRRETIRKYHERTLRSMAAYREGHGLGTKEYEDLVYCKSHRRVMASKVGADSDHMQFSDWPNKPWHVSMWSVRLVEHVTFPRAPHTKFINFEVYPLNQADSKIKNLSGALFRNGNRIVFRSKLLIFMVGGGGDTVQRLVKIYPGYCRGAP